ncbi:MAG: FliM/FliN family flagellar motor switch protein [Neomegalonema sp.]|nr:FliM/FliN family flagellar motor switch protein [Neomegalonema sp.]
MLDAQSVIVRKVNKTEGGAPSLPKIADILNVFVKKVELLLRAKLETTADAMVVESSTRRLSDVLENMMMPAMIGMVEIEGTSTPAMVALDLDLANHIIDLEMGGQADQNPSFTTRFPTATDGQVCAPIVDLVMAAFRESISTVLKAPNIPQMRCKMFEHDPMMAAMVVEHAEVAVFQVSLDIGEAARSGNFELIVPMSVFDEIKSILQKDGGRGKIQGQRSVWTGHMIDVVLDSKLDVKSVVDLSNFSIAELARLSVGDVLPLPRGALQEMSFQIDMGEEQREIAKVQLGAFKKNKAVKLLSKPDPEFFEELKDVLVVN